MEEIGDIQALFARIDWEDAFVKYMHFDSPTSVDDTGIYAFECLGELNILLMTLDSEYPEINIQCFGVHSFIMSFSYNLDPQIFSRGGRIYLQLLDTNQTSIVADRVAINIKDNEK